jgi:hypothetical protein
MSLMRLLTSGKTLVGLQEARPRYRMTDPRALPKFGSGKNPFRGSQKTEPVQKPAQQSEPVQMEAQALIGKELENGRQPVGEGKAIEAAVTVDAVVRVERDDQRQDFAGTGRARPVTDDAREDGTLSPSFVKSSFVEGTTEDESSTEERPRLSSSEEGKGKPQLVRQARGASWLKDWAKRLGSLVPIRPRLARSAPRPQQGELSLSLDQVTVVRNDLSDSDLEIVPATEESRKQKAESRKVRARLAKAERSEPDWPKQKETAIAGEAREEVNVGPVTAWGRATRQLFGVGKT